MQSVAIPIDERVTPFDFKNPKPMAPPIVRVVEADLGYEENNPVLRDVNLRIDQDDRIVILGPNGEGKSTLVKAISSRIKPLAGNIYKHKKLDIAYFSQHQVDELKPGHSPYDHVRALMPDGTEAQVRSQTAILGFGPEKADTKIEKLSGGEKARLLLGLITFHGPHMIILDEPTNHLDIDSREALAMALNDYKGAVLLITHDAHLAAAVADRLWLVKDGKAERYDGDLDDYRTLILEAAKTAPKESANGASKPAPNIIARKEAAAARESISPLKKRAEKLEARVEELSAILPRIDNALAEPGLYDKNVARATKTAKRTRRPPERHQRRRRGVDDRIGEIRQECRARRDKVMLNYDQRRQLSERYQRQ